MAKIVWKRATKVTGLGAIGHDNSRRAWILVINGLEIGHILHTQACVATLRWSSKEEEAAWKIMFLSTKDNNLIMKIRFPTPDKETELKALEEAKATMLKIYPAICLKYPNVRQVPAPTPKP